MLEKPDVPDERIISCLRDDYGLRVAQVTFLPLGNDVNTAVYQVVTEDEAQYFLKLRGGQFDEAAVAIPRFLADRGITQIIAPITTRTGRLWTRMDDFAVALSPFVAGRNGWETALSDRQWADLGVALKGMHAAVVPPALRRCIPRETYSPYWRDLVRMFQAQAEEIAFADPVAVNMAAFLRAERDRISDLVRRTEQLGNALRERSLECVLCHADIHAGNVLLGADDALYIVDWDTLIFAPKEHDLMFTGGGIGGVWQSAREEALFYRGYGKADIDPMAIAYYRYERVIQDIAAYGEQLLLTDAGGADREPALGYLMGSFLPDNVLDIADRTDTLPREL